MQFTFYIPHDEYVLVHNDPEHGFGKLLVCVPVEGQDYATLMHVNVAPPNTLVRFNGPPVTVVVLAGSFRLECNRLPSRTIHINKEKNPSHDYDHIMSMTDSPQYAFLRLPAPTIEINKTKQSLKRADDLINAMTDDLRQELQPIPDTTSFFNEADDDADYDDDLINTMANKLRQEFHPVPDISIKINITEYDLSHDDDLIKAMADDHVKDEDTVTDHVSKC